ncbi:phosphoribosyltransferase [Natronolimnohabitans innermongolicus]|uniref:Phosphoribosyltransferase n=1 Tax=Natronolimnohabitans innermongolicus JCM 12255 TaxID=1227499 RepID=L9WRR2_9EURY|nr:phosphoribosyltransferase family protein [Natronolimnohabitans innermongolicus]ELY52102.1 phosphoribosyltransferase [Natronolimnohabitans innermongolicus JCM 12255]
MFDDRTDAGERLAADLESRGLEADLVAGIPRGALPVARPVADALDTTLDVVVARKMGAPENPELALGAVASDGSAWYNDDLIDRLGVSESYLEDVREKEAENAAEKADRYRETPGRPDLAGKRVIVVDDGVATGATARACLRQVRADGAAYVALAVPVGSPQSLAALESEADDVIALQAPESFRAVGQFYRDFGQVTDEEAVAYLDR